MVSRRRRDVVVFGLEESGAPRTADGPSPSGTGHPGAVSDEVTAPPADAARRPARRFREAAVAGAVVVLAVAAWGVTTTVHEHQREQRLLTAPGGVLSLADPPATAWTAGTDGADATAFMPGLVVVRRGTALVGLDVAGSDLIAVAQLGVVVIGYAFGPAILSRWMGDLPGIGVVAASLAIAAVIYIPVVSILGSWPTAWPSVPVLGSVIALGVVCSALAFLLMFALIAEIGPMRMTTITYVNPAVAIVAGALVLGEQITVWTIVGFVLVLGGSYLVTRKRAPEIPADPDAAPAVADAAEVSAASDPHR